MLFFLADIFIFVYIKTKKPDEIWYRARSISESVKTLSWRFMVRAHPFSETDSKAELVLTKQIKEITEQNKDYIGKFSIPSDMKGMFVVSKKMKKVRTLSIQDRVSLYDSNRISDQEEWYLKKTCMNKQISSTFFTISISLYICIIALLAINIKYPNCSFPIELLAVVVTAVGGWVATKKYDELSYSHSLATHDIALLKKDLLSIETEENFSQYVLDCENAFSREHNQWYARKYF